MKHAIKGKTTLSENIYADVIKQAIFSPRAEGTREVTAAPLSPKNSERYIVLSPLSSAKKKKFKLPKIMEVEDSPVITQRKKPLMEPDPEVEV